MARPQSYKARRSTCWASSEQFFVAFAHACTKTQTTVGSSTAGTSPCMWARPKTPRHVAWQSREHGSISGTCTDSEGQIACAFNSSCAPWLKVLKCSRSLRSSTAHGPLAGETTCAGADRATEICSVEDYRLVRKPRVGEGEERDCRGS